MSNNDPDLCPHDKELTWLKVIELKIFWGLHRFSLIQKRCDQCGKLLYFNMNGKRVDIEEYD